jgi:hypothetical protein
MTWNAGPAARCLAYETDLPAQVANSPSTVHLNRVSAAIYIRDVAMPR